MTDNDCDPKIEALAKAIWDGDTSAGTDIPEAAIAWPMLDADTRAGMIGSAKAALRHLGFVDPKGNVYCPDGGAIVRMIEALDAAADTLLDIGDERTPLQSASLRLIRTAIAKARGGAE